MSGAHPSSLEEEPIQPMVVFTAATGEDASKYATRRAKKSVPALLNASDERLDTDERALHAPAVTEEFSVSGPPAGSDPVQMSAVDADLNHLEQRVEDLPCISWSLFRRLVRSLRHAPNGPALVKALRRLYNDLKVSETHSDTVVLKGLPMSMGHRKKVKQFCEKHIPELMPSVKEVRLHHNDVNGDGARNTKKNHRCNKRQAYVRFANSEAALEALERLFWVRVDCGHLTATLGHPKATTPNGAAVHSSSGGAQVTRANAGAQPGALCARQLVVLRPPTPAPVDRRPTPVAAEQHPQQPRRHQWNCVSAPAPRAFLGPRPSPDHGCFPPPPHLLPRGRPDTTTCGRDHVVSDGCTCDLQGRCTMPPWNNSALFAERHVESDPFERYRRSHPVGAVVKECPPPAGMMRQPQQAQQHHRDRASVFARPAKVDLFKGYRASHPVATVVNDPPDVQTATTH